MEQPINPLWDKISLFFKEILYRILSEENLEKIMRRKEDEIEDIDIAAKLEIKNIREAAYQDLKQKGCTDEEIEEMLSVTFEEE
ncbi:MAG: hypothetical protein WC346_15045 [Methanogenium sp.]|jgi:hypothetical protein